MAFIDIRTVFIVYVLTGALCAIVMASLWRHNRERFRGISLWLIYFILQFIAFLLIALRALVPDFASIILANTLIIGSTVILYIGLERFLDKKSAQWHNYLMVSIFTIAHVYFTYIEPKLSLRNINLSLCLLFIFSQCAWLMFYRVEPKMRPSSRATGIVFVMFCLVSLGRIVYNSLKSTVTADFFKQGFYDALVLVIYMVLYIALTFVLFTLVNRRLSGELENELAERRRSQTILLESEDKLQAMATSALDAIVMMDDNGNISFWNKAAEKIFGYTRQEVLGQNLHALLTPARYHEGLPEHLAKFQRTGEGAAIGKTLGLYGLRKDGTEFPLDLSLSAIKSKDQWVAVGIIRDVTERNAAEEELKLSEEKYRSILENISEGYFETNLKGDIVFANDSACGILGYNRETLYKINYRQFSTPDTKKKFQEIYGKVFKTGIISKINDYEIIRGDGVLRINELSVALIKDDKGNPVGFRTMARDITEKKQAEELIKIRLSLLEFAATHSLEELLQKTLDEVEVMVNSPISFYHFVEKDQKTLSLQAWSTRTLNEFCKAEGKGMHYGIDQAGVWVDCVHERRPVVHNDYNSLPHRKGMPEGHAAVIRELVVPIMRGKNIVAILGVGNKPTEYTQKDIEIISYLADVAWEIAERKKAEEERNKYSSDLRERMKEINCLYSISEIVRRDELSQEEILKQCPGVIAQAYRFPEITACCITWGDHEYKTENFKKTEWSQNYAIMVHGRQAGSIEVYCVGGKDQECYDDFFLAEEGELLKNIADLLGRSAERRDAEEKIKYMATHDSLTDLPTLKLAEDRLTMAMGLASRHKEKVAVMFIDLDGFKTVNDTLGHDAGDFLLKTLAQRFLSSIRKTDTIARVGGDEFLLIATELNSSDDAVNIAKKVLKLASKPFTIEGQKATVSASIGIAFYPDHGENIDQLIKLADEAMYRIKNTSKNGFSFAKKIN